MKKKNISLDNITMFSQEIKTTINRFHQKKDKLSPVDKEKLKGFIKNFDELLIDYIKKLGRIIRKKKHYNSTKCFSSSPTKTFWLKQTFLFLFF